MRSLRSLVEPKRWRTDKKQYQQIPGSNSDDLLPFLFMNKKELLQALEAYQTDYKTEQSFVPRFLSLLRNFENCYRRSLVTGHMTASAWIVDKRGEQVLLVHHKKLDRWLQPGGHADGDENILNVARKEAEEETGLSSLQLHSSEIFDIDIHLIPERGEIQTHNHYDIRFLFTADISEKYIVSEESHDLSWVKIDHFAQQSMDEESLHRMTLKTNSIFK